MANTFFYNTGKVFMKHYVPCFLDCNFIVDANNANGLGIASLKGPGIRNVFMHTSTTPGTGNGGVVNPNPASGYIAVQLEDNYNRYLWHNAGIISPLSGSNVAVTSGAAALTVGELYTITVVGTTTAAEWISLGLIRGVTAAVGATFVAASTGVGSGSGQVQLAAAAGSGISHIEALGNPQIMVAPMVPGIGGTGSWLFLRCMKSTFTGENFTPAGTVAAPVFTGSALGTHTHSIPPGTDGAGGTSGATSGGTPAGTNSAPAFTGTAAAVSGTMSYAIATPAEDSTIQLQIVMSNSSVTVQGE